jgi:ATP/ADP translocase
MKKRVNLFLLLIGSSMVSVAKASENEPFTAGKSELLIDMSLAGMVLAILFIGMTVAWLYTWRSKKTLERRERELRIQSEINRNFLKSEVKEQKEYIQLLEMEKARLQSKLLEKIN